MRLRSSSKAAVAVLLAFALAACSGTGSQSGSGSPYNLTLATGASGAVYAIIGAGAADLINRKNPDIRVAAQASAGGVENMRLVGSKQVHMGFATADVLYAGYNGEREFTGQPFKNVRAVLSNYVNVLHLLVPNESPVKSPADLKGKTISVGAAGSLPKAVINTILEKYYGLKAGTDYKEQYLSTTDGLDALKNRQIDAQVIFLGLPAAAVIEAMTVGKLRFLNLPNDVLDKAVTDFPYWSKFSIPKSVYPSMAADAATVGIPTVLITQDTVPDDVVYRIIKTILENQEELAKVHSVGKEFTLENATKGVSTPFHPGAVKYLKEKGVAVK